VASYRYQHSEVYDVYFAYCFRERQSVCILEEFINRPPATKAGPACLSSAVVIVGGPERCHGDSLESLCVFQQVQWLSACIYGRDHKYTLELRVFEQSQSIQQFSSSEFC